MRRRPLKFFEEARVPMRTASALLKLALGLGNVIIAVLSINNEALKH